MNGTVSRNKYFCESAFYMLEGIPVRKGMFLFFGMRTFFLRTVLYSLRPGASMSSSEGAAAEYKETSGRHESQ